MIRRSYSPPFQSRAPQPGADDIGKAIKGLVNVEVSRSNEISFAVESFGCDGKPVLSTLRGLSCEVDGKLAMVGTKNGMPFKLGSDLPRGVGSAIRGAGGGMVNVSGGVAMLTREWVIYDNFGNHWSLDQGSTPVYLGETPPLASGGDGISPALCEMDPQVRPHEIWFQYYDDGGAGEGSGGSPSFVVWGIPWRYGWTEDSGGSPVYSDPPVIWEYPNTTAWRVTQWIPDETTAPDGTGVCGVWPASKRRALTYWSPTSEDPHDFDAVGGGIGTIVSAYPTTPDYPPTVPGPPYYAPTSGYYYWLNEVTRPAVEQISVGGTLGEAGLLVRVETNGTTRRYALHDRYAGTRLFYTGTGIPSFTRADGRHFWTPKKDEGWYVQNGVVTTGAVTLGRYHSRASSGDAYGSALSYIGSTTVTLPTGAVHAWESEPVWFRVGRVSRSFGNTRLTPYLPRW